MNKVTLSKKITSGGGAASVIFPAKVDFRYEVLHLTVTCDLATDIQILDGSNEIWAIQDFIGTFSDDLSGHFYGSKNTPLTCIINNSTAKCSIYMSVQFG